MMNHHLPIACETRVPNDLAASWSPARLFDLLPPPGAPLPAVPHNIANICPITREPIDALDDLVLAQDNYLYDRDALKQMLALSPLSPMSRQPMPATSERLLGYTVKVAGAPRRLQDGLSLSEVVALSSAFAVSFGTLIGTAGGLRVGRRLLHPHGARRDGFEGLAWQSICVAIGAAGGALAGTSSLIAGLYGVDIYLRAVQQEQESAER